MEVSLQFKDMEV